MSVVDRTPVDVASDTEHQEGEGGDDDDDGEDDDPEDVDDNSEDRDETESSPLEDVPIEGRAKARHKPSGRVNSAKGPGDPEPTVSAPQTRSSKHGRAKSARSPEKAAK